MTRPQYEGGPKIRYPRLIVCGGRDRHLKPADLDHLSRLCQSLGVTEIITGGASGVDEDAHQWALANGYKTRQFPADWWKHGRSAGPIRNAEMVKHADAIVAFRGSAGTTDCLTKGKLARLLWFDWRSTARGIDRNMLAGIRK